MIERFIGKYAFLSNFSPSEITYEGVLYPTVEHAFQAAKTTDPDMRHIAASRPTPAKAKSFGRQLPLRRNWDTIRLRVMDEALRLKFAIPELRKKLVATGDEVLVEGNTWGDTFWGVCGTGTNHLGILLMKIRKDIMSGKFDKKRAK